MLIMRLLISISLSGGAERVISRAGLQYCMAALVCGLLGACSSQPVAPSKQAESYQFSAGQSATVGSAVAQKAYTLVGSPYEYGGYGPRTFDCSGLVYYSYQQVGYSVPRTSAQQYRAASPVPVGQAQAGDLLFFRYEDKVSHVAIYLGDEQFVHAPSSGKRVSVASLRNAHYQQHFVSVGRLPVRQ
jgi:cell wall-associated NlpC family hydrolase